MIARIFAILVVAAGLAGPVAANEEDRDFLTGLLEDSLSDAGREVRVIGFAGALSSRATIDEITIADEHGVWLTLRGAVLDWNRSALLRRRVEVNELSAQEIILDRAPGTGPDRPSPEARPFALPELPVSLRIDRVRADSLVLGEALFGARAEVRLDGSARLSDGSGTADFEIVRIDGAEGALRLDGTFDNATRMLRLDMGVQEAADGIAANLIGLPGTPAIDLSIAGEGPLDDFTAEIGLATDGSERLSGEVQLIGEAPDSQADAGTQRFRAELGGDIAPLFAPDYRAFFGNEIRLTAAGARHADGRMELSTLDLRANAIALAGEAALSADGLPQLIQLEGEIAAPDGAPVVLPLAGPRTMIDRADLTLGFDASRGEDWRAEITAEGVARPDIGIARLRLAGDGRISQGVNGAGVAAQFTYGAEGLAPTDPDLARALGREVAGQARMEWQQGDALRLRSFGLSGSDYTLSGRATLRGQNLSGNVAARLDSLARFSGLAGRPLSGQVIGSVDGSAELLTGAFDIDAQLTGRDLAADQAELDRLLAGISRIRAVMRRDEAGTAIERLDLNARTLSASLSGTIASAGSDVNAVLDFSDLTVLGNGYGGALAAQGRLTGDADAQRLSFTADGQDLSTGQAPELDRLLAGESRLALEAVHSAGVVEVADFSLSASTLSARVAGRIEDGASDLSAELGFSDLATLGPAFGGSLEAEARLREDGALRRLTMDATGNDLALGVAEVDRILSGESRLSLDGHQQGGRLRLDSFDFASALLTASASATVDGDSRLLELSARLADLGVLVPELPGPVTFGGRITEAPDAAYQLDLSGSGPGNLAASVTGRLTQDLIANLAISGTGNLALSNRFHDPITVQGPARYELRVDGPLDPASLSGTLTATGARIVAPEQGVTLEDLDATAQLGGGQVRLESSAAIQGGGRIQLTGNVGLRPTLPADLSLVLNRARITDRQIFETRVSGNLGVTGPLLGGDGLVSGTLSLEDTEVRIPSTGLGAGEYIPPLTHVGESTQSRRTRRSAGVNGNGEGPGDANGFNLDLELSSPNRVFIRGRGLDAELGGSLRLTGTTQNIVPAGEFTLLRGRLDILGRRFSLSDGVARMQGRFVPFVRLTATTSTDGITASIILEGEADALGIRFVSSPELPEEEVVARLLFGRELGRLSPFQAAQLASAVATLAGRGGEGLVGNLRRSFGLDDLDVSTGTDGVAALRLGKYISDNVYTDVTVDAEGRSEVSINLDVSPSVTVRGRTDNEGRSGIGVFFERDY